MLVLGAYGLLLFHSLRHPLLLLSAHQEAQIARLSRGFQAISLTPHQKSGNHMREYSPYEGLRGTPLLLASCEYIQNCLFAGNVRCSVLFMQRHHQDHKLMSKQMLMSKSC